MKSNKKYTSFMSMVFIITTLCVSPFAFANVENENRVVIYSSMEEEAKNYTFERLKEKFPEYEIVVEYLPTGHHAARLKSENTTGVCDITIDLEFSYLAYFENLLAPLDEFNFDYSVYIDKALPLTNQYVPSHMLTVSIVVNEDVLKAHNLPEPKSFKDLLKPEYKGFISMANPKTSSTGFNVYKVLSVAWGEEETLDYFDALSENILQYTTSGFGPVKSLALGEVAIALGITSQAVAEIGRGSPFKILEFAEGTPYSMYGYGVIKGKEKKKAVQDVVKYLNDTLMQERSAIFYPESIYKDIQFDLKNYPKNRNLSDMGLVHFEENQRLLQEWQY